jgi:hypothetical protein
MVEFGLQVTFFFRQKDSVHGDVGLIRYSMGGSDGRQEGFGQPIFCCFLRFVTLGSILTLRENTTTCGYK